MTTRATRSPRRRTVVALAVVLAVLGAFVVRLVDIQVVRADEHVEDSRKTGNLGSTQPVAGNRGDIVDENGTVLASSKLVYDAVLDPKLIVTMEKDPKKAPKMLWSEASEKIAAITGQTPEQVRKIAADKYAENPESQWAPLKEGLSTEQYLELKDLGIAPRLSMTSRAVRVYPNGAVGGNLVGFVNSNGAGYGVEKMEAQCLAPRNGERTYLRGKNGVIVPGSDRETPAVDGGTVKLTIDSDLEWYLSQMIAEEAKQQGAKSATATVVEVKTGKIRAAAQYPALDPNNVDGTPMNYWRSQIFSHTYEPGSTFKPVTAATLIEEGAVTPSSVVTAKSRERFPNGANIGDAFPHPLYHYTLAGALIDSSNVALSKFGSKVSPQVRYDYLKKFGVGTPTAIDFPGQETGGVRNPSVKPWDAQSLYATTFGQAFEVTPIQVASAYQTLANGGEHIDLSLVESCTDRDGVEHTTDVKKNRVVSPDTAAQVRRMLENVAVQGGLSERVKVPGYRIGIKTGTAEVANGKGGYKSGLYYTSILGVAPIEDPQYVVMITMEEPTRITSSAATAPALQKALTQVLKTYRVAPSSKPMEAPLPKFGE
ncbi:peptidoglycan D,D-transpeptidase FtsI family protein [Microbacterium sp. NPDC057659]|uniref:peptidoglycan D,D-transpeptidase FtsI family protein n=1 Tax=Microbacterium sp. NPDC057659 TaxID=3346198 RepID=UPI00366DA84E